MYTLHIGTDTCWNVGGWDIALFAEVGYTEKDYTLGTLSLQQNTDIDIVPLTANIKFERALTGNLGAYFGAGLGFSYVDVSTTGALGNSSGSDWVFTTQVFAGLVYNVNSNFEVFGGARWIYFDDANLGGGITESLGSDYLFEIGARYNF